MGTRGGKIGHKGGGRPKGTPNKCNAQTREQIWAEINRRTALGQVANPFIAALDILCQTGDQKLKLQAAEFLGDRLLPKLKAVEHSGEIDQNIKMIQHRYGQTVPLTLSRVVGGGGTVTYLVPEEGGQPEVQ